MSLMNISSTSFTFIAERMVNDKLLTNSQNRQYMVYLALLHWLHQKFGAFPLEYYPLRFSKGLIMGLSVFLNATVLKSSTGKCWRWWKEISQVGLDCYLCFGKKHQYVIWCTSWCTVFNYTFCYIFYSFIFSGSCVPIEYRAPRIKLAIHQSTESVAGYWNQNSLIQYGFHTSLMPRQ